MVAPNCRHLTFLFIIAVLVGSIGSVMAHEVEITADEAVVKVRQEVIATVKRGERYKVLRMRLPWVAISVDGARRVGWVGVDKVRLLVGPDFDDTAAAPESPSSFSAQADLTQVNGTAIQAMTPGGAVQVVRRFPQNPDAKNIPASYLAFRLTLRNDGEETIAVASHDFKVRADDVEIAALGAEEIAQILAAEPSMDLRADPSELTPFPTCRLGPGDTKQGWLCFDLTALPLANDMVRMPKADRWLLHATWENQSFELDLKANESHALNATARQAQLDPTVQVVEIGNRINALNLNQLVATLESLKAESGVVFLQPAGCHHDQAAQAFFQSLRIASSQAPPDIKRRLPKLWQVRADQSAPGRRRRNGFMMPQPYFAFGPIARSEPLAVIQLLAERPESGPQLVKHLSNDSPEIRAATAQALANHLADEGVIAGLVLVAKDSDVNVRAASLRALGTTQYALDRYGRARVSPTPTRQSQDPAAAAAVLAGLHDPQALVRQAAAAAANAYPLERVETDLISLLDDNDLNVQIAACQCLGQLKSNAALPRLREISEKADDDPQDAPSRGQGPTRDQLLRTAALDALVALEAVSPVDAAIAKLKTGNPAQQDFAILTETPDERAVPLLIERIRTKSPGLEHLAIQALGDSGDARAVEPLLDALSLVTPGSDEVIVQALGELRDRRAIEPLRRRLARTDQPYQRVGYLAALLLVDDPQVLAEVESLLKTPNQLDPYRGGQLLVALGRSGQAKAPDIIEPFLDDPRYCQSAATAAALSRLPKAYTALASRLESPKYAHGAQVVNALAQNRSWALSPHGQTLLKSAAQSRNAMTRSAASSVLRTLQTAAP